MPFQCAPKHAQIKALSVLLSAKQRKPAERYPLLMASGPCVKRGEGMVVERLHTQAFRPDKLLLPASG